MINLELLQDLTTITNIGKKRIDDMYDKVMTNGRLEKDDLKLLDDIVHMLIDGKLTTKEVEETKEYVCVLAHDTLDFCQSRLMYRKGSGYNVKTGCKTMVQDYMRLHRNSEIAIVIFNTWLLLAKFGNKKPKE